MTFGLLTTKWRILHNDQQGTQDTISKVIEACIQLHNFVIDTDGEFKNKQPEEILSQIANVEMAGYNNTPLGYHHTVAMDDDGEIDHELMNIPGVSITQETIRDFISSKGYTHPDSNIARNAT